MLQVFATIAIFMIGVRMRRRVRKAGLWDRSAFSFAQERGLRAMTHKRRRAFDAMVLVAAYGALEWTWVVVLITMAMRP